MGIADQQFLDEYLDESVETLNCFVSDTAYSQDLIDFSGVTSAALVRGNKILLAGNGRSTADAQHNAGEFFWRLFFDYAPLPAIALTTNSSVLTAVGNDYSYENVFERQVLGLGEPGDIF